MVLREPVRSRLFHSLEDLLGPDEAAALMDALPAFDPSKVVTIEHLDLRLGETEARLRAEIGDLRTEMHSEIGDLRTELRTEIGGLRTEMALQQGEFGTRFATIETRLADLPDVVTKQVMLWLVPVFLTVLGLSFTLSRVGH